MDIGQESYLVELPRDLVPRFPGFTLHEVRALRDRRLLPAERPVAGNILDIHVLDHVICGERSISYSSPPSA